MYSTDWAVHFRDNAIKLFKPLRLMPAKYLEIGVFEGRSMGWMFENVLLPYYSQAIGVDFRPQQSAWDLVQKYPKRLTIYEGDSKVILPRLNLRFDMIYIDGDHSAKGCLFDSVAAWQLCRQNGIILWDDYAHTGEECRVSLGVTSFLACIRSSEYKVVCDNWQYGIQKLSPTA